MMNNFVKKVIKKKQLVRILDHISFILTSFYDHLRVNHKILLAWSV